MFSKKKTKVKITILLKLVIVSEKALQNSLSAVDGYENEHNPVDYSVNPHHLNTGTNNS